MQTKLTFSQEDSHANPTQWQGNEKAKTMTVTSGLKCLEQLEKLPRVTSWERMFLALLIGTGDWYSKRCVLTWRLKATRSRPWLYLRRRSMPRTEGIEFGLLQSELLPTPTAMDSTNATAEMKSTQVKEGSMHSVTLSRAMTMGMLPTPNAQEGDKITGTENQDSMTKRVRQVTGTTSQLNPRFVAEMMGFPVNWTELPFQSGVTNQ